MTAKGLYIHVIVVIAVGIYQRHKVIQSSEQTNDWTVFKMYLKQDLKNKQTKKKTGAIVKFKHSIKKKRL